MAKRLDAEALRARIARLSALRDRPGTPAEGRAAERALRRLLRKYGQEDATEAPQFATELHALELADPRTLATGMVGVLVTTPLERAVRLVGISPGRGTSRASFILLTANVIDARGVRRPVCLDRRICLLAYSADLERGGDLVLAGERIEVTAMAMPTASRVLRLRVRFTFGVELELEERGTSKN